jgi:uncharacterized protein
MPLLLCLLACSGIGSTPGSGHLVGDLTFDTSRDVRVFVSVADSPEERQRGLMGITSLDRDAGMIFVFQDQVSDSFWMKDTLIPLSIAFWNEDGVIIDILDMEPCHQDVCPTYGPRLPYTYALEMNAGWFHHHDIAPGDHVDVRLVTE